MDILMESLTEQWQGLVRLAPKIVLALVVFVLFIWIGRLLGRVVVHLLARGNFKTTHRNFFRNLTAWVVSIVGVILALNVLGLKGLATSLLAGGGITAVVLGFAFREIGENFLAGFFLAFGRPFDIGDLIRSGDLQGTVKSIDLRSSHIRSDDGRDIFIPSSQLFNNPVINFTKDGLRRLSFQVGIDYADDARAARQALLAEVVKVDYVLKDPVPGITTSALAPQYVELTAFFWIDTFAEGINLGWVRDEVIERCRLALMSGGFTVSANITTNVALSSQRPVELAVNQSVA